MKLSPENRFYIGNCKEETVINFLENYDDQLVGGFYENGKWAVLFDSAVLVTCIVMKLAIFSELRMKGKAPNEKIGVDEGKFMKKVMYRVNESVLHELAIHGAGQLEHDYLLSLIGVEKGLDGQEAIALIEKYNLKNAELLNADMPTERMIFFMESEKQQTSIRALYENLKSRELVTKVGYKKKEYPLEFGLSDITFKDEPHMDPAERTKLFKRI